MQAIALMSQARAPDPVEEALVARSQEGDLEAFNTIVEQYQGRMYNLSLRMLGDQTLAEDATQEAFISAFQHIRGFRGGSLRAWLLRIAANACRDLLRSAKRRRDTSLDEITEKVEPSFPSRDESPEDYTLRQELGREIQQGLDTIAVDQKLAIVLVDMQGLSYEEAAESVGTSVGTIKSRLSRGRASLRDYLRTKRELLPSRYRQDI